MISLTEQEEKAKQKFCLALDAPIDDALKLVDELSDYVGIFKVGKQLHTEACFNSRNIVGEIYEKRLYHSQDFIGNVFLDLKFHDTPSTVYEASKACAMDYGVYMLNVHVAGGEKMCKKALEGVNDSYGSKLYYPKVIGVTVLTSLDDSDLKKQGLEIKYHDLVRRRTELAREWGLDGIVCPANKAGELEKEFGEWLYVTPGIEWNGKQGEGQKQLYTPDNAVRDCKSSILVIGSAITKAKDRKATAYEILQAMAKEI